MLPNDGASAVPAELLPTVKGYKAPSTPKQNSDTISLSRLD